MKGLWIFALAASTCVSVSAQDLPAGGKPAAIDFDTALSVACRIGTPKAFTETNGDFKVVEALVRISANFAADEKSLESIVYKLKIPSHLEVADYLPKTELGTDIAGPINTEKRGTERASTRITVEAGGKIAYRIPIAEAEARLNAGASSDKGTEVLSGVQMSQLPPKQLVLAAGTESRGQTLYFKLRPFSQITLEGMKEFALLLIVPKDWTGDCVQLECTAWRPGGTQVLARKSMTVALYTDLASKRRLETIARQTPESTYVDPTAAAPSRPAMPAPSPAPTPVAPAEESLTTKRCAGAYKVETQIYTYTYELGIDGKWEGKRSLTIAGNVLAASDTLGLSGLRSASLRGTWSINENKLLTIIAEEEWGTFFGWYKITPIIPIREEIASFDPSLKAIVLKSGVRLGPK